jgi:hypothetical protein
MLYDCTACCRLLSKLSEKEFQKERNKQQAKRPSYIDLVPSENAGLAHRQAPLDPVKAGYALKQVRTVIGRGSSC